MITILSVALIILGGCGIFILTGHLLSALVGDSVGTVLVSLGAALVYTGFFLSKL